MAVFTTVSSDELTQFLAQFDLGNALSLEGIPSGIENTNYFLGTDRGSFVLTLFEKLTAAELPFYLGLMGHLAAAGLPCPSPAATRSGTLFHPLKGKPASVVTRLAGKSALQPGPGHCSAMGEMTARLHLAAADFPPTQDNPRGPRWWARTAPQVMPFLPPDEQGLLREELATQLAHRLDPLPRGVVHADLFRDNVLFDGERIGGVIDFYFAGADIWLFDLAVVVNDWAIDAGGRIDGARADALLQAYQRLRPLTAAEREAWPIVLRAAALRFWLSRLFDLHLPRPGELIHPHDPSRFRDILRLHREGGYAWNLQ
ncbi:MAG: homoserine kinase [Pseudomonadota bacterium]|nr:homoserine kinase [Pseudomonadota bacterium]